MARLKTGDYKIEFYDEYGGKLRDHIEHRSCLADARKIGREIINDQATGAVSFSVDRRVFNSLDNLDKW